MLWFSSLDFIRFKSKIQNKNKLFYLQHFFRMDKRHFQYAHGSIYRFQPNKRWYQSAPQHLNHSSECRHQCHDKQLNFFLINKRFRSLLIRRETCFYFNYNYKIVFPSNDINLCFSISIILFYDFVARLLKVGNGSLFCNLTEGVGFTHNKIRLVTPK